MIGGSVWFMNLLLLCLRADQVTLKVNKMAVNSLEDTLGKRLLAIEAHTRLW